ncbi:MAG: endonuclease/exonuclease/phosphatase family protein [Eubacteriales bacterium]
MKRYLLILVALIIGPIACFISCNGEQEPPVTEDASQTAEGTTEDNSPIVLFDANGAYYGVVRSAYAETVAVGAAKDLNSAFRNSYANDWNLSIKDDFFIGQSKNEYYEIEGAEILVGLTNRIESKNVHDTLSKDEYLIKIVGDKLVIIGYDDYATVAAVEHFVETYLSAGKIERLELPRDLELKGEASLRKVSIHDEATYRIMTWNLGCLVCDEKNGETDCVDIILNYLPDILGLQECNAAVHNKVLSNLPDYYEFANKKHTGSSTVNYTPIIYNTDLFTLLKSDLVWLRGRYTGTNTKSLNWAVFEDKNGIKFALINFHGAVCSNSYKGFENYTSAQLAQQANEWKLDNVKQVIEVKNAIIAEFGNIPIMVSGDNNFNSSSQQYANMIADGFTDAEQTARISRMTGYKTSYSYGTVPGSGLSIDHIFGMGNVDFVTHAIVRGENVWKASDHSPVYVDFNLK